MKNKNYILGITSLWLLIPILQCIKKLNTVPNIDIIALIFFAFSSIISTLHWSDNKKQNFLHKMDRLIAVILFIFLTNHGNMKGAPIVLLMYLLSQVNKGLVNIICDLAFRFTGYWWVLELIAPELLTKSTIILNSIAYCIHIYSLWRWVSKNQSKYWFLCIPSFSYILLINCIVF